MEKIPGLVCAYLLDGKGGGRAVDWPQIDGWQADQGVLWVHLDSRSEEARSWLERGSGLGRVTRRSLLEKESRPRTIFTGEGLVVILRGVNCNPGDAPEDMVAIRMLLSERRVITLRYRRVMAVQDLRAALDAGTGPTDMGDFLVMVTERIADRMGEVITELDDNVDALEDAVLTMESAELRPKLAEIRRSSILLRRYIAPQKDVLARLLHDRIAWLSEMDRSHLREVAERTARYVEDVDAARERAAITQEELNNKISEQMNKAVYTLSIVAAIFLPLGLLTGLLGINVGGIPGTEYKWAFAIVSLSLFAIAAGLVAWFKKIRWL